MPPSCLLPGLGLDLMHSLPGGWSTWFSSGKAEWERYWGPNAGGFSNSSAAILASLFAPGPSEFMNMAGSKGMQDLLLVKQNGKDTNAALLVACAATASLANLCFSPPVGSGDGIYSVDFNRKQAYLKQTDNFHILFTAFYKGISLK